jgi:predicted membrane channel-forming protein YqfA (hemolysin III family)
MLKKRLLWTVVIVLAVTGASTGHIDRASEEQAENALKNALVTFAVARTLNGVISAAQGTEVALEPGGVGVVLSVGEILDPINDLIERFSAVMLIAASSLGLQALLLNITSWWGVTGFLFAAAAGFLVVIWTPRSRAAQYAEPALRILLFLLFVRFAVPVLIVGTTLISDAFLAPKQAEATAILRDTTEDIERINDETQAVAPDDQSFMDRLGEMIDESLQSMRVGDRMQELKESASNAAEHIVSLIAIFVLQTILLPLLFIWLFLAGLKGIAGRSAKLFDGSGGGGGGR